MKNAYVLLQDRLKGEYKEAFDAVEKYKFTNLMDSDSLDDQMMELLDQLLMAQENKDPVSHIVGDDMDRFCRNFFGDYKMSSRMESLFRTLSRGVFVVFIFTGIECIMEIAYKEFAFSNRKDVSYILFGFCLAMIINGLTYLIIRPLSKAFPKVKNGVWEAIPLVVFIVVIFTGLGRMNQISLEIPSWIILLVSGIYIAGGKVIKAWKNKKLYGSFRAPKQEKIRFWDTVNQNSNRDLVLIWYKTFKKKNKKLEKKGKEPLASEAYLQTLAKNYDYKKRKNWTLLVFVGLTAIVVLQYWITSAHDYEGIVDAMIYTVIMGGIEGLIGSFFLKTDKNACEIYAAFIADLERSGLSYADYMEKMISENET